MCEIDPRDPYKRGGAGVRVSAVAVVVVVAGPKVHATEALPYRAGPLFPPAQVRVYAWD